MDKTDVNAFGQPVGRIVDDWRAARTPDAKSLVGAFCRVEPIDMAKHARGLFESLTQNNLGEGWTYLPYGPFEHFTDFSDWLLRTMAEPDIRVYAILSPEAKVLGIAPYLRINPMHGAIEVGHIHYSKPLQKTPAATEAMYLMMKHVFDDQGYRRYEWKCHSLNEASKNAALRLGFKFEGIFRQCNVFKGRNRDTAWFSIIDGEWPDLKQKFLRWLDPSNFDATGNQIRRLSEL